MTRILSNKIPNCTIVSTRNLDCRWDYCLKILRNSKSYFARTQVVYTSCSFRIINYLLDQIILEVKRGKVDCIESTEIGRRLGNLEHGNDDCQTSVYRLHARIYACGYTDQGISAITEHSATRWMYQPLESNSLLWLFSLPFHRSQPLYLPLYFAHYAKICSTIHDTRLNPSPRVTGYQGSFRDDSLATVSFYLNDTHTHTHTHLRIG